ncbi:hypothetical protein OF83DRAFT_681723 [Amylostereum chailletii]|nr:hypothetical protein OF83DRAFT_681723 [Amylostereum chailletii]
MSLAEDSQGTLGKGRRRLNVAIVGGGISGLYSALLLQREGHHVRIFEGTHRIGGRVHTHYFTTQNDQYFEAGAMRIPNSSFHHNTFELIKYIQSFQLPKDTQVDLITYVLSAPGNRIYINGCTPDEGDDAHIASIITPSSIDWEVDDEYKNKSAGDLMQEAIGHFVKDLKESSDFEKTFRGIVDKFDNYSFRFYCSSVHGWPTNVIDFVETVMSQTNQFALSVPELIMQNMDFDVKEWKTIKHGMSRLPLAMASLVGYRNITFGARVTSLQNTNDGRVTVTAVGYNGVLSATFDRVIMAIPPAALKMIADRPRWSPAKEMAIRSIHFEALYKMGMRFKTRFWEQVPPKSHGGQDTTDLPIRWIVYPSNGIGSTGPGVLLVYAWMTDAGTWLPLTPIERRSLALHCVHEMYDGLEDKDGNVIDVYDQLIETADAVWSESTATGDAMFLPGQFADRFDRAREPEGKIFFAGEHLSYHHTWITGAVESALYTARKILDKPDLKPLRVTSKSSGPITQPLPSTSRGEAPIVQMPVADVDFKFCPNNTMFHGEIPPVFGGPSQPGPPRGSTELRFPLNLGGSSTHILGAEMNALKGTAVANA